MVSPDLRRAHLGINDEIARAAERMNRILGPRSEAPNKLQRVSFDDSSHTITLDQFKYENLDPVSYKVFKGIYKLHGEKGREISETELRRLPGLKGKTIARELRKLPMELQDLVGSKPGAGRWIDLPHS